nr:hypothetical protein [Tanacetum cinerariifolium]
MTTLADKAILSGAHNRPPMLEKDMYNSWKIRIELYMMNRQHGRMILEYVQNGPLIWPTIKENGVTRPRKYSEWTPVEAIQADCDVKATNIILQGLSLKVYALERECKLYDEFDKFAYTKRETLRDFYLRFSLLLNDMNIYNVKLEQCQVNTKFLNTIPPEWSKYVTDVKLLRNSSNPRQQATINDGRVTLQPVQGDKFLLLLTHQCEGSKELPKVSMVNTSLKKLKHHLAGFDVVVKERTTTTAITEGSWGFKYTKACFRDEIILFVKALKDIFNTFDQYLIDELTEVQNVFHQMKQAVDQHRLESKTFEVKMNQALNENERLLMNQALNENERLLEQVINNDIMNIVVNSTVDNASSQEKDTVITKLKKRIKSLTGNMNEDKVKKDIDEIETINIELDHREQGLIIAALKDDLRKLKGKAFVDNVVKIHTIALEMLKIDVEPLAPGLLNNRAAHSNYLGLTQEQATILREVVKQDQFKNNSVTGFPAQSNRSSNAIVTDSPYLLVLSTEASKSRQHGKE